MQDQFQQEVLQNWLEQNPNWLVFQVECPYLQLVHPHLPKQFQHLFFLVDCCFLVFCSDFCFSSDSFWFWSTFSFKMWFLCNSPCFWIMFLNFGLIFFINFQNRFQIFFLFLCWFQNFFHTCNSFYKFSSGIKYDPTLRFWGGGCLFSFFDCVQ